MNQDSAHLRQPDPLLSFLPFGAILLFSPAHPQGLGEAGALSMQPSTSDGNCSWSRFSISSCLTFLHMSFVESYYNTFLERGWLGINKSKKKVETLLLEVTPTPSGSLSILLPNPAAPKFISPEHEALSAPSASPCSEVSLAGPPNANPTTESITLSL